MSSKVFRLPGELRNKVYKHVLSSPTPLLLVTGNKGLTVLSSQEYDDTPREFNKLQYVNTQLLLETSGIEILFNDIKIARQHEEDQTPGVVFLDWVATLPRGQRVRLDGCTIILADEFYTQPENRDIGTGYGYLSESAKTIAGIVKFCKAHPVVKVDYKLPCLDLSTDLDDLTSFFEMEFIAYNCILSLITQNIDEYEWSFNDMRDLSLDWKISCWRRYSNVDINDLRAPNLRFKPSGAEDKESLATLLRELFGQDSARSANILRWAEQGL